MPGISDQRLLLVLAVWSSLIGGSKAEVNYQRDIAPLLAAHCYSCHGPHAEELQAGLRLDLREMATQPADSGQRAIVPGAPERSELMRRIVTEDHALRMPPPGEATQLTHQQQELIRAWIASGAVYQYHWSFVTPGQTKLPEVYGSDDWVVNPIDRFVLSPLQARGMVPSPEASRATLARRVSLDLRGLPPTLDELDTFLEDASPDAYQRLVSRMLSSPQFGEKMALLWMDLARYGDTNGFHSDSTRHAWIWREWVIAAYNQNMPFDRFTVEQLAGDLLPNATLQQQIASGFNRNSRFNEEGGADPDEWLVYYAVDRTKTLGRVWLGLTLDCAECHSHKYDPISQREFYQLYAFFNSLEEVGAGGVTGFHYQPVPPVIQVPGRGQAEAVERITAEVSYIEKQIDGQLQLSRQHDLDDEPFDAWLSAASQDDKLPREIKDAIQQGAANRSAEQLQTITDYYRKQVAPDTREIFEPLLTKLSATREELQEAQNAIPLQLVSVELAKPRAAHMLIRGDFQQLGPRVERDVPAVLPPLSRDARRDRLGLARWLVDPRHPLTARVTVNRYWAQLFGRGIVDTVADFGKLGQFPTHPQLLDWLATEFIRSGWDTKHIFRLILTSATYRQASANNGRHDSSDPDNLWLSRAPRFRLQAEEIRDNALRIADLLQLSLGGPGVFPFQPPDYFKDKQPRWQWNLSLGKDRYRRGMYTFWRRTTPYPAFVIFDAPDRCESTVQRPRTNTPLQALVTMNEPEFVAAARGFARRIMVHTDMSDSERIRLAFRTCLARSPANDELNVLQQLYHERIKFYEGNLATARQLVGESDQVRNEDDVKHLAAWTFLTTTLLNLDETVTRE